jgi:hypothetical protein
MIRDNGELCFLAQVTSGQYDVHNAYISPDRVYPIDYDWSRHDGDDRWHCSKCINLMDDYCAKQGFRPVDDIPRRCEDFRK